MQGLAVDGITPYTSLAAMKQLLGDIVIKNFVSDLDLATLRIKDKKITDLFDEWI